MSSLFNAGVYAAASAATVLLVFTWKLSALSLFGLQAYLLPDDSAKQNDQQKEQQLKKRKDKEKFLWNEGGSEILRITIGDSYLENTRYFPEYDQAVLYSALAVSVLIAREYLSLQYGCNEAKKGSSDSFIPLLVTGFSILKLVHILCKVSWDKHTSRNSEWALSCGVGLVGFTLACIVIFALPRDIIDLGLKQVLEKSGPVLGTLTIRLIVAALAGWLTGLFLGPVIKSVRCFWLGTNQLGWDISVVKTGLWTSFLLHFSMVLPLVTALLWFKPMSEIFIRTPEQQGTSKPQAKFQFEEEHDWARNFGVSTSTLEDIKFVGMLLAGLTQLLLLRINVQSYLNLAVLAWYESLHGTRTPDTVALKTKILVVNHFICRVAVQNLVPAMLLILFAGLSRTPGASAACAAQGNHPFGSSAWGFVAGLALFFSWWTLISLALLSCTVLALFRFGLLLAY